MNRSGAGRYVRSLYFALSTTSSMGYGNGPAAVQDVEYVFAVCVQLFGACISAVIFSNISSVINKGDAASMRFFELTDRVNEFIRFHHLPTALKGRLRAYTEMQFSLHRGIDAGGVVTSFPTHLQDDIYYHLHERLLRQVPMFNAVEDVGFIRSLSRRLKPQVLLAGDFAFQRQEVGDRMFFIQKGHVQICNDDQSVTYATLGRGGYFGELAMLTATRRIAGARALDNCILYVLTEEAFEEVMRYYPNHYDTILEQSLAALEATLRSNEATLETRMIQARLKSALVRVMTERTQVRRGDKGLGANKRDGANGFVETVDAARRSVLPGGLHVGRRYSRRASSCGASASSGADRRQSAMPWQATLGCAGGGAQYVAESATTRWRGLRSVVNMATPAVPAARPAAMLQVIRDAQDARSLRMKSRVQLMQEIEASKESLSRVAGARQLLESAAADGVSIATVARSPAGELLQTGATSQSMEAKVTGLIEAVQHLTQRLEPHLSVEPRERFERVGLGATQDTTLDREGRPLV